MNRSLRLILLALVVGFGFFGAKLTQDIPFVTHQKYFYIRCTDSHGHITYESKSTEYPAGNILRGLGTCSYVYR